MWKIDAGVVTIGGKQVVDENGKKYPKVKSVKECKFVYLIYFIGHKKGLKLGKDKYAGSSEVIKRFQPKPSRQLTKEKQNRLPAVTHIEPSFGKSVEDDNFGEFTVDSKTLSSPPQEYLCRTVREDWVVEIRNKIREQAAIPQGTHLPVLVDPSQNLTEDSCSTIKSMASYSERCYISFISLVKRFEAKQGCQKNIPQKLFRALQGLSEETTFSYLSLASEEGLDKTAGNVYRLKARKSLQTFLCQAVGKDNWEEAYRVYPEVSNKIEELVEKKIRRKFVPEVFSAYCHSLTTRPVCNNEEETQPPAPEHANRNE